MQRHGLTRIGDTTRVQAALRSGAQLISTDYPTPSDLTDYLVAKTTPEMTEMARSILSDPARAPGLPGTQMRARLWSLSGMVVRTDLAAKKVEIVDPNSGEIIRSPWIKTPEGQAELAKFKPGDMVTMVFSERSAFEITPVR